MNTSLQVYLRVSQTAALGPGLRFGLWVQGCPFRCAGCMTPGSLDMAGGTELRVADLAEEILSTPSIEGLTISGGEPFAQAPSLSELLQFVLTRRDLGVIVYSGYRLEALASTPADDPRGWSRLLSQIDLLVDGTYVAGLNDGGRLRGSANQRAHALTPRYSDAIAEYGAPGRQAEVRCDGDDVVLVGIPGSELLRLWRAHFSRVNPPC